MGIVTALVAHHYGGLEINDQFGIVADTDAGPVNIEEWIAVATNPPDPRLYTTAEVAYAAGKDGQKVEALARSLLAIDVANKRDDFARFMGSLVSIGFHLGRKVQHRIDERAREVTLSS